MLRILILEDDAALCKLVGSFLSESGFETAQCRNGVEALQLMEGQSFDLIVSDIMMPEMDGFAFAEAVRVLDKKIPILFMTARDDMVAKQRGYDIGIDDYMVKPIDTNELLMRIRALLRRANIESQKRITVGNFMMDREEHTSYLNGEELSLTVREFDILYKMLSFPKRTFSRSQLMELFWDYDSSATSRTVDVYMAKLREKTAACDGFEIVTVHGLGYKAVLQ